ncbi:hypothetical protein HBH98_055130 [Parastagonospora nodorum]|nr:hypothetical protein HBH53_244540 [Parastagonospora nodorum]KAH3973307.1 hypothetical protein HBH52_147090 [Parastagonospora nodorum]KAH4055308.1 hypothetical protein HBH49_057510 [Parastagonospora nodorum]KAH4071731.1 hypothetical protein HBH50_067860 [Parastagonospora nodorum]KAH4094615.1 hypothetical protein HBH48_056130 [Parastagonospora nodorum]
MSAPNTAQKPLRIGVFFEEVQMFDLAGLDVFGSQTPEMMAMSVELDASFKPLMAHTTPMEFLYIASSLETSWVTPKMLVKPTHTYENAPRDLDILLLGGPNPAKVAPASLAFLKEASLKTKVIMTTCTGAVWLAKSGVLDGKKATTNRAMIPLAKTMAPNVEWVDQRWIIEKGHFEGAEIWTAGAAGCGVDMCIEYADLHFSKLLNQLVCIGLGQSYEGRSQFYDGPLKLPF